MKLKLTLVAVTDDMGTYALLVQDIPFINQLLKPLVDERSKKEIPICSVQTRKGTVKQQQQIADDQTSARSDATVIPWHQLVGLDTDMVVPNTKSRCLDLKRGKKLTDEQTLSMQMQVTTLNRKQSWMLTHQT